jgi:putative transposase
MPRIARVVVAGYPHHVTQRGNNKADVFFDENDRWVYLYLLKNYSRKYSCPVLAYCLMPNHVHLLVRPLQKSSLSKTMQGIALCYTQYINKKYNKSGRLWESRYYSCVVDGENYLWPAVRYIEQNPRRGGLVDMEEKHLYSSAKSRVTGAVDEMLDEEIFGEKGRSEYVDFLHSAVGDDEINDIRSCTRTGRPFGSKLFIETLEQSLGISLTKQPRGRPRKTPYLQETK